MIGTPWSCADEVWWWQYQQHGGLLVQLDGFMDIELVGICLGLAEAKALEEEPDAREESVLQVLRVGAQWRGRGTRGLEGFQPLPLLPVR